MAVDEETSRVSEDTGFHSAASAMSNMGSNSKPAASESPPPVAPVAPSPTPSEINLWSCLRVLAAWLLFITSWGPIQSFGVFEEYYRQNILSDQTPSNIAWIGSSSTTLLFLGGGLAGPLFDMGYLKEVMTIGCFAQVFAFMMLSLSRNYYSIFLTQGVLFGIGCGVVYLPAISFVTMAFTKWRGVASGVASTGAAVGGIIFPPFISTVIERIGFGWTCRCIGFIQLFCSIVGMGLLYNAPIQKTKPRSLIDGSGFRSLTFMVYLLNTFCTILAYWIPVFFIPTYAASVLGASAHLASYMLVIFNGGSAIGRVASSFLVKRFGAPLVYAVAVATCAVLLFSWIAIKSSIAGFVVWCVLFGWASGTIIAAAPVVTAHPVISPDLRVYGTRLGMLLGAGGFGALIGTPIAGALAHPSKGQFVNAQAFSGASMTLATLAVGYVYTLVWKHDRNSKREKEKEGEGAAA